MLSKVSRSPGIVQTQLSPGELVELRADRDLSISVCLPALNEATTIGDICGVCRQLRDAGLIQQLVVVDSGSIDDTPAVAAAAGAEVHLASDLLSEEAPEPSGKGGALWKSLSVATGDIVVWVDSDTRNFTARFVTSLIEPLLRYPHIRMTKAFYDRPLVSGDTVLGTGGARVTELAFRPLAQILFPDLVHLIQPLSGEYAARREDLLDLAFFSGYGVETGLLIDFANKHGTGAIAQVDLGARLHENQDVLGLGRMAFEVIRVLLARAEQSGKLRLSSEHPNVLRQFQGGTDGIQTRDHYIPLREFPPMRDVLSAMAARA